MTAGGKWAAGLAAALLAWASLAPWELRAQGAPAATPATAPSPGDYLALQRRYQEIYRQVRPAVVRIHALRKDKPDDKVSTDYTCTGFFINREGMILTTNADLLAGAERVVVEHEGLPFAAEVVAVDSVSNVALVRALRLPKDFVVLPLTEDAGLPPIASQLFAVTCKMDEEPGPSTGLLLGFNTDFGNKHLPTLHLRTSLSYDGGEGGSPVFDLTGRLVGVMLASLPETRSSLVLPTAAVERVREELAGSGHVSYGRFGFVEQEFKEADTGPQVLVTSVEYGGPAAVADLRTGDQLLAIGSRTITRDSDLRQAWFFSQPGQVVTVRVRREGKDLDLPLKVGQMTSETAAIPKPAPAATPAPDSSNTTATPPPDTSAQPPPFSNVPVAIGPRP